jgi:hypothetical protein
MGTVRIHLVIPDGVAVPPVGTVVQFTVDDREGCVVFDGVSDVAGYPVAAVVVPEWTVDHFDDGPAPSGSGWHQTRTAHGSLPASGYVTLG